MHRHPNSQDKQGVSDIDHGKFECERFCKRKRCDSEYGETNAYTDIHTSVFRYGE